MLTPEERRQRQSEGGKRGAARGLATQRAEREAGLAFAREWRERNRGRDWSVPQ